MRRTYKALSLSSGAARGFYELGAVHAAQINNLLTDVTIFAGSSVGAMIALMLAVGWSAMDLFTMLCTDDINQYINVVNIDIYQAVKTWGLFDNLPLRNYISKLIIQKWGGIPTFKELHAAGITFVCTAYRMKHPNPRVYFSYKTHPDMSVLDAVMLSGNIPLLFRSVQYEGDYYIDGGSFELNPAEYIDKHFTQTNVVSSSGEGTPSKATLSINLDLRDERDTKPIETVTDYIKEIVFLTMYNQKPPESTSTIDALTIRTDLLDNNIPISIDKQTKIKWFVNGLEQGLAYFREDEEE